MRAGISNCRSAGPGRSLTCPTRGLFNLAVAVVAENDGSPNINEVKLYVDGLPDEPSVNASDRIIDTVTGPDVTIGQYNGAGFFEDTIDEVRIYNRALDADEIDVLANP